MIDHMVGHMAERMVGHMAEVMIVELVEEHKMMEQVMKIDELVVVIVVVIVVLFEEMVVELNMNKVVEMMIEVDKHMALDMVEVMAYQVDSLFVQLVTNKKVLYLIVEMVACKVTLELDL
jgi:hypothetical protein